MAVADIPGSRGPRPGHLAWVGVAALLGACAMLGWPLDRASLDWQPGALFAQPWRMWSAVAVHYSLAHLAVNLVGALLVAALGWAGRVTRAMAWAWLAAWPLTQLGLLADPRLAHYGGLSGVLHAGVAVAALHLLRADTRARRRIGLAILCALAVKVVSESPWAAPWYHAGLDITVAPLAHASGLIAGVVCAGAALLILRPAPTPP
jgi:rhomboid family GlyGly-CTERM serine protease